MAKRKWTAALHPRDAKGRFTKKSGGALRKIGRGIQRAAGIKRLTPKQLAEMEKAQLAKEKKTWSRAEADDRTLKDKRAGAPHPWDRPPGTGFEAWQKPIPKKYYKKPKKKKSSKKKSSKKKR